MTCHCVVVWIICSPTYSFDREHECHICCRIPWKIVSFSSHLFWDQYENVISFYAMELIREMTFLLQIIIIFIWKWDSSVHSFIAHSQELILAIVCWYKFVKECICAWATVLLPLFSQINIGTVTTSTSVAATFSVAHLFLSTLHKTENIVQYDCDVSAWLHSVIKFNIMTQIGFILLHSVREPHWWGCTADGWPQNYNILIQPSLF